MLGIIMRMQVKIMAENFLKPAYSHYDYHEANHSHDENIHHGKIIPAIIGCFQGFPCPNGQLKKSFSWWESCWEFGGETKMLLVISPPFSSVKGGSSV